MRAIIARRADGLIALAFLAAALAIRLPEFMQIPRFSDEGFEALWALDIVLGKHYPLTNVTPQLGPIFPYLLAFLFHIVGIHLELPRLMTTVFSSLTVGMTYAAGRYAANRVVGIIAGSFALTNPALVVFGHNGWSGSLTPFFATAAFAALYAGIRQSGRWLLPAGGLLLALAIQAHATSAALAVGMTVAFFGHPQWRILLKRRDVIFGVSLFVLGCMPMLLTWGVVFSNPSPDNIAGIFAPTISPSEYLERLISFLRVGGFFLGGGIGEATWQLRVQVIVVELVFLLSLLWVWRAGQRLLPLSLVGSFLILPIFISQFSERYYSYLLPFALVLTATFVEGIWKATGVRFNQWPSGRAAIHLALAAFVLLLCVVPVVALADFYAGIRANQQTNAEYFRALQVANANHACGETLFVENAPRDFSTPVTIQSWYSLHALDALLTLDHCAHTLGRPDDERAAWLFVSEPSIALLSGERSLSIAAFSPPLIEYQALKISFLKVIR